MTITALLLALIITGLPFIMSGPVKDDDILTPLPTPETTAQESSVIVTTKKRTDVSPAPSSAVKPGNDIPSGIISGETVTDVIPLTELSVVVFSSDCPAEVSVVSSALTAVDVSDNEDISVAHDNIPANALFILLDFVATVIIHLSDSCRLCSIENMLISTS